MDLYENASDGEVALFCGEVGLFPDVLRVPTPWKGLHAILSGGFYGGELIVVDGDGTKDILSCFVRSLVLHAVEEGTKTLYMNSKGSNGVLYNQFILGRVPVGQKALGKPETLVPHDRTGVQQAFLQ